MNVLRITMTVVLGVFLFFPGQALAVDFSIERSDINAEVQESGDVYVTETHTYEFDGEFNGISRGLVTKKGTEITEFQAFENNDSLNIEQDGSLYRIYRSGDDETITVTLTYMIKDGVTVHEDMGQFFWPFFSEENESDYENMVITLTPPSPTEDVLALGYGEAEGTAVTDASGTVVFNLGHVSEGKNGDVKAAWNAEVFAVEGTNGEIRSDLMSEIDRQEEEAAAFAETRGWIMNIGIVVLVLEALLLGIIWIRAWVRARGIKRKADSKLSPNGPPREIMSLMGTISFNYYHMLTGQAINAALLELVRKGHVIQETEREFRLIKRNGLLDHERILAEWLFDTIGNGDTFTVKEVEQFAKKESNQKIFQDYEAKWHAAIKEEVDAEQLSENISTRRRLVMAAAAVMIPFLILFPLFDLLPGLFFSIVLIGGFLAYVLGYHPRTLEGVMINREWQRVKKNPDTNHWTEDDQMRVYLYGIGTNDEKISGPIEKKFSGFTPSMDHGGIDVATLLLLSVAISPGFESANASASSTSASSAASGSAGGVGGGGGGSGAF
ncbi:DUF2207 domain-containing protein [Jeotgalibacillus salarius]|uniref:DUF2207 domain-containing protein n=1 Tax=Jeotgalibacillus salarius TaxID=546023 RepID=A0A4Y8LJ88_9BACL|nr:DUF2207 domain-containing protein [Jeotgalibacillus salarius]TFE02265.1 DUF2207 domain-containing protein [Jeotgalibacillus salarius]